jgi:hypothetical protein
VQVATAFPLCWADIAAQRCTAVFHDLWRQHRVVTVHWWERAAPIAPKTVVWMLAVVPMLG